MLQFFPGGKVHRETVSTRSFLCPVKGRRTEEGGALDFFPKKGQNARAAEASGRMRVFLLPGRFPHALQKPFHRKRRFRFSGKGGPSGGRAFLFCRKEPSSGFGASAAPEPARPHIRTL